jgi:hypothetical protein
VFRVLKNYWGVPRVPGKAKASRQKSRQPSTQTKYQRHNPRPPTNTTTRRVHTTPAEVQATLAIDILSAETALDKTTASLAKIQYEAKKNVKEEEALWHSANTSWLG